MSRDYDSLIEQIESLRHGVNPGHIGRIRYLEWLENQLRKHRVETSMADKTKFSDLLSSSETASKLASIPRDQRACVNCVHGHVPTKMEVATPYLLCKWGPPSVLVEPSGVAGQLKIANRWPAMKLDEECGQFLTKHGGHSV